MLNYKDHYISSFVKGLHYPVGGFHNIDDPTFLGFTLMFHFADSPLFKGAQFISDEGIVTNANDLSKLTCAFNYLYNIGEFERIKYLKAFINNLTYINNEKGFYWQEIEGIDTIWESYNDFEKLPVASYWEFGIKTLETVDMKIFGLFDLLRKAAYDYENSKTVLPSNLQRFHMTVYVSEVRNFHPMGGIGVNDPNGRISTDSIYGGIDLSAAVGLDDVMGKFNIDNFVNQQKASLKPDYVPTGDNKNEINAVIIEFTGCKFKPVSGGDILSSVSNSSMEMASNSIKVEAKSVNFTSVIPWFNKRIDNNPTSSAFTDETKWESIQRRANSALEKLARDTYESQKRDLQSNITQLIKSNVPGGLIGSIQELERGNLINAAYQLTGGPNLGSVYDDNRNFAQSKTNQKQGQVFTEPVKTVNDTTQNQVFTDTRNLDLSDEVYYLGNIYSEGPTVPVTGNNIKIYPDMKNDLINSRNNNL